MEKDCYMSHSDNCKINGNRKCFPTCKEAKDHEPSEYTPENAERWKCGYKTDSPITSQEPSFASNNRAGEEEGEEIKKIKKQEEEDQEKFQYQLKINQNNNEDRSKLYEILNKERIKEEKEDQDKEINHWDTFNL